MSDKIYVHGSDVDFNTIVYCMMRAYHLPTLPGQELPLQDTWFAVPAVKHGPIITLVFSDVETAALMMIDSDGRTVKSHRVNLNTAPTLSDYELNEIKKEAFDIPAWERVKQMSFPYASMFDQDGMRARFETSGLSPATIMRQESTNEVYTSIRRKIKPQPCTTCGKNKR